MPVFTLPTDLDPLKQHLAQAHNRLQAGQYLVVCYCAAWCDTCRQYASGFAQLAEKWPEHTFIWVDIEETPELLGDEDAENFPTLLVQSGGKNRFFGPMLPHIGHLDKLLETADRMPAIAGGPPDISGLLNL